MVWRASSHCWMTWGFINYLSMSIHAPLIKWFKGYGHGVEIKAIWCSWLKQALLPAARLRYGSLEWFIAYTPVCQCTGSLRRRLQVGGTSHWLQCLLGYIAHSCGYIVYWWAARLTFRLRGIVVGFCVHVCMCLWHLRTQKWDILLIHFFHCLEELCLLSCTNCFLSVYDLLHFQCIRPFTLPVTLGRIYPAHYFTL